ncbi:enoyl-CoA hydratase [Oceanobacillus halotolerans]|uniref:enoyl-CoA hydratase n=1 Tax=Oceanobacillus halotolerans TaxID=2663380 RepID=UPI0013D9F576|nr:enoyl-CoA hydratase [Oceanobacillus halotolerans]
MSMFVNWDLENDHIAIITINRPNAANALSRSVIDEFNNCIHQLNQEEDVRCVIITGAGEKAFCAGADLKERKGMSETEVMESVRSISRIATSIERITVPVIAAINGAAYGGGLELALACDLRIASRQSKMGLTETSLAIIPGAGGTQRLSRLIGLGQAKRLIYTAKPVTAEEAFKIGLVEELTEPKQLIEHAMKLAHAISKNGPIAVKQAKKAINQGFQTDITTGLEIEHLCYTKTLFSSDRLEGLQAFKEKRKPVYEGK